MNCQHPDNWIMVFALVVLGMGAANAQSAGYLPRDLQYLAPPLPPPSTSVEVPPQSQSTQMTKPKPKPEAATNIPLNPTREQIIASCIAKLSIQERAAFQQTKTRMDAAEILQSIYQERYDFFCERGEQAMRGGIDEFLAYGEIREQRVGYKAALLEVNELIYKLASEPPPPSPIKKKKKK